MNKRKPKTKLVMVMIISTKNMMHFIFHYDLWPNL